MVLITHKQQHGKENIHHSVQAGRGQKDRGVAGSKLKP